MVPAPPALQTLELVSQHPFGAGGLTAKMFRLANGLKVILVRDPSAPVFAYQTWFAVGSRHEREGITGIAHLFEHLMFNQTESHPPGELDRLIESAGGDTNAATWVDWTYYRDNLPRAELALAIELEADRMAHLVLGETQVESEREVVANERRFRVEDDVDGFLNEELYKLAFTSHPYHWPTIGWMRDIEAITIEDCRTFYRTYYAPNNATVVLVGDVDEEAALKMIAERYGKIPASSIPADPAQAEPEQTAERRATYHKPITADKLRIGYKAPPLGHPDYAVLEVVSEILFGGNSSRLHRRLVVDGEIASSVHASTAPFRDPGLYEVSVSLQRGHASAEAEAIVYEELERLVKEPLQPHELDTAKTRLLTHFMRELRPSSGKAEALGHYETTIGDYRKLFAVADGYRAVAAADVARVVAKYLTPARRTVVLGVPSTTKKVAA
jgi:zinc protease